MESLLVYLLLVNALGFILMLADKENSKEKSFRIPELSLFTVAVLGGSLGTIAGMRLFRHKTRKPRFSIGLPIIFVLQAVLLIFYFL